mmetsp:Transcript_31142/g.45583  ORF Transcript_31142/g.45583 Transcript_31142/m.45583 type:complete len:395 (+) Transcript_31142:110-1294(+)
MMKRLLLINLALAAATCRASMHAQGGSRLLAPIAVGLEAGLHQLQWKSKPSPGRSVGHTRATRKDFVDRVNVNAVRGGSSTSKAPPAQFLKWAYGACGLATTAAWSTALFTTVRSNQPVGAMMPCWQHQFFARVGGMAAVPLIVGGFGVLACSASRATESWEQLGTPTCRRHNLALMTTGLGGALWTYFAETVTKIPGTGTSHQVYTGAMKWGLMGCYGSGAVLAATVWAKSLPDDVRSNPLSWPGRIADGVSKSLVSLAPANKDDPVNVKYALLATSFLAFTGMQTVCNMPIAVMPSWLSRRISRKFALVTLLGATTSFDLKEAAESGKLLVESNYRTLSKGVKGFGALYFAGRSGVFFDPSFPEHFGVVNQVPGLAVACALMVALTLRSDEK